MAAGIGRAAAARGKLDHHARITQVGITTVHLLIAVAALGMALSASVSIFGAEAPVRQATVTGKRAAEFAERSAQRAARAASTPAGAAAAAAAGQPPAPATPADAAVDAPPVAPAALSDVPATEAVPDLRAAAPSEHTTR